MIPRCVAEQFSAEEHGVHVLQAVEREASGRGNEPDGAGALGVTTADITDRKGALAAFAQHKKSLSTVVSVLADSDYSGQPFADGVHEILGASVQIAKRNELHKFVVMPQRWIVERSFAWLEKCHRLWKNCERQLNTSLQFMNLAFLVILLRRI